MACLQGLSGVLLGEIQFFLKRARQHGLALQNTFE